MNRFNKFLVAAFMSVTILSAGAGQAMEIREYDKMAQQDRNDFAIELIFATQHILDNEGRSDLASQVHRLFTETPAGDEVPLGLTEFTSNIDRARLADAERAAQNPNAHRLEIEDALLVTLQKNNIPMTTDFVSRLRAVGSHWQPEPRP